jgi:hypothetical protein
VTEVRNEATVEPTKMPDSHDALARARSWIGNQRAVRVCATG